MPPSDDGMGSTSPPNPPPVHGPTHGPKMTGDDMIFDWDSVSLSEDDEFIAVDPPPVTSGSDPTTKAPNKAGQQPEAKTNKSCNCSPNGRNLVVCIDGTANQFSEKNTNVVELYSRLIKDKKQLTYYNSGIGTYARKNSWSFDYWKQALYHHVDMAVAWNLENIVFDAYRWLSENYEPDDRIFLFGFSRGAYQVRIIAGMIQRVGLLHKGNDGQISFAHGLYMATLAEQERLSESPTADTVSKDEPVSAGTNSARSNTPTWLPKLSFWPFRASSDAGSQQHEEASKDKDGSAGADTPGNVNPSKADWFPWTWSLPTWVAWPTWAARKTPVNQCNGSSPKSGNASKGNDGKADPHKLSERFKRTLSRKDVKVHFVGAWDTVSSIGIARGPGLPETTTGMKHVCFFRHALALDEVRVKFLPEYANGGVGPAARDDAKDQGDVKEVWFAGSHSDIGGGSNVNLDLDQFGPALRWMSYEASRAGLRTENFQGNWKQVKPTDSMNWFWRMLEWFPLKHLSYDPNRDREHTRWSRHLASPRQIMEGQLIHESVLDSIKPSSVAQQSDPNVSSERSSTQDPEEVSNPHLAAAPASDQRPFPEWRARLPSGKTWDDVLQQYAQPQEQRNLIEHDPYISAKGVLKDVSRKELSVADRNVLVTLLSSEDGKRSVADSVDASQLWEKIMQSTEDSEAHTIDCLLSLSAFPMSHNDAPTQTWMRKAGGILSLGDRKTPDLSSHQEAVEKLEQPFRVVTGDLLMDLSNRRVLSDTARDLLCIIAVTAFGQMVITDIAKESELVKALNTVQNDPDWRFREERITDLLILLGAFPLRSQDTKRYLNHNLARLFPLVQQRPGIDRVFDRVMCTARSNAQELVGCLVNRTGLSVGQRRKLDMLLFTKSGRKSIEDSGKLTELSDALKDTATDLKMEPNLRRTHITDIVAALSAFSSLSTGMEVLLEPEVADVISNLDTDRRRLSVAKDRIASSFRTRAGDITTKLASDGMADADRDVLERMVSTDLGKKAFAEGVVTMQLFNALGRVQDSGMDPELRKARVTDIIWVLGKFTALPPDAKQYSRHDLKKLLPDPYQERPEIDEAMMQIKRIFTGRLLKAVEGHTNIVCSVSFSPDGSQIASGSNDNTIRIWNTDTGKEIREPLRGHTDWVRSVSFSPDGKRLASASYDKTVRLWDVQTGQQIGQPLKGHTSLVLCVAFSPDGNRIVSGSEDKTLQLWDAQTGQAIGEPLRGHYSRVLSVAFSPDGKNIASGSSDRTIRLWDAETGEPVGDPLRGHDSSVLSVAYSPVGARIVSGSGEKTVRIWDAQTRQTVLGPLHGHGEGVTSVAFSRDGQDVVSGSYDGTMRIWDAQTGQTVAGPWQAHGGEYGVQAVAFSHDGKRVVSGGGDNMVKIWDGEVD